MYICRDCGFEFEEPGTYEEDRGEYWGVPCSETLCCCPACGCDQFKEIEVTDEDEEEE